MFETSSEIITTKEETMKVFFIDDRPQEIFRLWERSGCESAHELLPVLVFQSVEEALEQVDHFQPDIVLVGYGLSQPENGADVIRTLQASNFSGFIVANSGGSDSQFSSAGVAVDFSINRRPERLKTILDSVQ